MPLPLPDPPHPLALNPTWSSTRLRFLNENALLTLPHPNTQRQSGSVMRDKRQRFYRSLLLDNFFCSMFSIFLIVFLVFLGVAWATVVRDAHLTSIPALLEKPGLFILGDGFQLDSDAHSLSVLWKIIACDAPETSSDRTPADARLLDRCGPFSGAFDVYLNDPSKPAFSYSPHESAGEAVDAQDQFTFVMEHRIHKYGQWDPSKQLKVLFDHFVFRAFVFAIDPTTNHSLRISMFAVTGTLGDFVLHSHDIASINTFVPDPGNGSMATEIESRVLEVNIKRSAITKVLAICLSLFNWSSAVASVYITALVTHGKLKADSLLVTLPFSTTITIPTIRSFYTNSPPFGTSIDAVALFVQLLTVSLCSLVLLKALTRN